MYLVPLVSRRPNLFACVRRASVFLLEQLDPGLHSRHVPVDRRASVRRHVWMGFTLLLSAAVVSAEPLGNFLLIRQQAPEDINDNGLVVGRDGALGFVMRNGIVTPYVAAPVQGKVTPFSQLYGVNNAGEMVGEYFAVGVSPTGFLDRNGVLSTIAFPDPSANRTIPQDINNRGHIAGFFGTTTGSTLGFIMRGSQYEKIEVAGVRFVAILGMNDRDQLVGHLTLEGDSNFIRHGFLWSNGQVIPIAVPGAVDTEPAGIGEDGTIVGTYSKVVGPTKKRFAFVLRDGVFSTIGVPGVLDNSASGINKRGLIAGHYFSVEAVPLSGEIIDAVTVGWVLTP